jgi:hypothetical protein
MATFWAVAIAGTLSSSAAIRQTLTVGISTLAS